MSFSGAPCELVKEASSLGSSSFALAAPSGGRSGFGGFVLPVGGGPLRCRCVIGDPLGCAGTRGWRLPAEEAGRQPPLASHRCAPSADPGMGGGGAGPDAGGVIGQARRGGRVPAAGQRRATGLRPSLRGGNNKRRQAAGTERDEVA